VGADLLGEAAPSFSSFALLHDMQVTTMESRYHRRALKHAHRSA